MIHRNHSGGPNANGETDTRQSHQEHLDTC